MDVIPTDINVACGRGGKESGCGIRFDVTGLYLLFGTFWFCCRFPFKTYDENTFHAQLCIYEVIKISVCCEGKGVSLRLWLLSLSLCWTKFARLLHLTFPCCMDRKISGRWQVSKYAELNQERNRLTFTFSRLALFDEQWIMNEKILSRSQETSFVILNSKQQARCKRDTSNTKLITQMEKLSSQNSKVSQAPRQIFLHIFRTNYSGNITNRSKIKDFERQ